MRSKLLSIVVIFSSLVSCSDVFEEDIEDEKIILRSPPHRYESKSSKVLFWWDEVDGATEYVLQVVQPEFRYIEKLILDSVSLNNKFETTLEPGDYQWKVIALNNGYKIESAIWSFNVDSAQSISDVVINLISPANNIVTNEKILNFSWEMHQLAVDYRFELRSPDWENGSLVIPAEIINTGSFTNNNNLDDGEYEWGVQGLSGTSNTLFSRRKFTLDATSPGKPILNLPADESTITGGNVSFTWNRPSDDGSQVRDSFYLYTDATLSTLARPITVVDNSTYSDSLSPGTYYWRVKSYDEAGNTSSFSTTWEFDVTQ